MRYRLVPPLDREIHDVRAAVPTAEDPVDDCCGHLVETLGIETRDEARSWLVFLQALGVVAEGSAGYYRTDEEYSAVELRERFVDGVYGVAEVLAVLEGSNHPRTAPEIVDRVAGDFPPSRDWETYVDRLLGWAERFGLVREQTGGYVVA